MRAIDGGANDVRRVGAAAVGALLCCTLLANAATSAKAHEAGEGPRTITGCKQKYPKHDTDQAACLQRVHVAQSKCKLYPTPCIGPIDTVYAMDGLGGGDTKLIWATRPTKATIRQVPKGELQKQLFVCHTAPKVTIVAVFIVHNWEPTRGHVRAVHTRVPNGPHSCHVTLTWLRETSGTLLTGPNANPPTLALEGKRVR